jgi:hypothetical protein
MSETKEFTIKDLMNWCDAQVAAGKLLEIKWEGGGDSGWVHFEIDGEDSSEPEAEALVDIMYNQLDYGSWAGEFSASGTATYDPATKSFLGTDNYSEDESKNFDCHITFKVPKHIPFDRMWIDGDIDSKVSVIFNLDNGFIHPETDAVRCVIEDLLTKEFDIVYDNLLGSTDEEISNTYQNISFERKDFKEEEDYLVGVIKEYSYSVNFYDPRDVEICLEDMLEETNEED